MPSTLSAPMVRVVCIDDDGADDHLIEGAQYLIPESWTAHSLVDVYRTDGTRLGGTRIPHRWFRSRFREVVRPVDENPMTAEARKRETNSKRRALECPKVNLP